MLQVSRLHFGDVNIDGSACAARLVYVPLRGSFVYGVKCYDSGTDGKDKARAGFGRLQRILL